MKESTGKTSHRLSIDTPSRTKKPRENGLSNMVDKGYGLKQLDDILSLCSDYVDIIKLGWASAYVTQALSKKVKLFRKYNIRTCLGGMMFEICFWQGKVEEYADFMRRLNIDMVEVSNGSLPISEKDKIRMIEYYANHGFTVLSEVGSKDVTINTPPEEWVRCIDNDLNAGAWKVITEGRADASAGIYTSDGNIKDDIISAILDSNIPVDKIIYEAPKKKQMTWFIKQVGANVNIGNIPLEEIMNLETLRLGLRGDTVNHFHNK